MTSFAPSVGSRDGCSAAADAVPVSVILVSFNTAGLLDQAIRAWVENTRVPMQLIVVDNASTDGSVEMLRSNWPAAEVIQNPLNVGFARACNQGIAAARGRYVLLLNSDTLVQDRAVDKMIDLLERNPALGAVGCQLVYPDGRSQASPCPLRNLWTLALRYAGDLIHWLQRARAKAERMPRVACRLGATISSHTNPARYLATRAADGMVVLRPDEFISGACYLVRRTIIGEIGGLDEHFFMYLEDAESTWRIRAAGNRVAFSPQATATHLVGGNSPTSYRRRSMTEPETVYSTVYYFRKTKGIIHSLMAKVILISYALGKLAISAVCRVASLSERAHAPDKRLVRWLALIRACVRA